MLLTPKFFKISALFLVWRFVLFIVAVFAGLIIPKFGGMFPYYDNLLIVSGLPQWVWGFANFDGVHYIRLALTGYEGSQYSQAFFPLYPLLIHVFSFANNQIIIGLLISNVSFVTSLFIYYKLILLDHKEGVAWKSLVLLLVFPTSFYFGAVYSESLFLFLTLSSIYLARKKHFLGAGLYAALASSTRLLGLALIPFLVVEYLIDLKKNKNNKEEIIKMAMSLVMVFSGFMVYVYYLQVGFHEPLYFLTSQSEFGAQRSEIPIILLPQVIFRYLKMIVTVPLGLSLFNVIAELIFALVSFLVIFLSYRKVRFSYIVFVLTCLIVPTLTGTLSSMPRYSLMIFLSIPFIVERVGKWFVPIAIIFSIIGAVLTSLFVRGYWIA